MRRLVCLAMLCTAVLAPRAAHAQEEDATEAKTSLSLTPFNGPAIGLWHRFTPRLEIGLEAGMTRSNTEAEGEERPRDDRTFITVEPS